MHAIKTTIHLRLPRATRWLDAMPPALIAAVLLIALAAGIAFIGRSRPPATPAPAIERPTSALIMVISTPAPTAPPLPTPAPRMITAYDQPNGAALGPIPEPPISAIVARWGDAWLQTAWDGAPVWILADDLGARLADVRPVPAVVIAPAQPAPAAQPYTVANQPPSASYGTPEELTVRARHVAREIAYCAANPQNALCIASPPSMENP